MKQTDFFQLSDLKKTLQIKKVNDVGQKIVWKVVKYLPFSKDVGVMYSKDSLVENAGFSAA
jgi:hypothetical protein